MKYRYVLCLFALCAFIPGINAQDAAKNETITTAPAFGVISPVENNRRIARWVLVDVRGIVECSQEALTRSSNESVKNFAHMMVQDHKDCLARLEQIRDTVERKPGNESNAPVSRLENTAIKPEKSAVLSKDNGQSRNGKMVYRIADFVAVKEAICERMKEAMMKEIKQLSSSEFDEMYTKHMVMSHEALLASSEIIAPYASDDLKTYLQQHDAKLKDHLAKAKALCSQVNGKKSASR